MPLVTIFKLVLKIVFTNKSTKKSLPLKYNFFYHNNKISTTCYFPTKAAARPHASPHRGYWNPLLLASSVRGILASDATQVRPSKSDAGSQCPARRARQCHLLVDLHQSRADNSHSSSPQVSKLQLLFSHNVSCFTRQPITFNNIFSILEKFVLA